MLPRSTIGGFFLGHWFGKFSRSRIAELIAKNWLLALIAMLVGLFLGSLSQGALAVSALTSLDTKLAQNAILAGSVLAAIALYGITAKTAMNRAATSLLMEAQSDRDLIKNSRDFNNTVVWYSGRLAAFAVGHQEYTKAIENGEGVPKSPLDPRRCKCNCECINGCRGHKECQCDCDSKSPPRKLNVREFVETRESIIQRLNYYEYISIGIFKGAYREAIIRDASRTAFVQNFIKSIPYINAVRTRKPDGNPALFEQYEKLARLWAKPDEKSEINRGFGQNGD